jgi:hypothetical protein
MRYDINNNLGSINCLQGLKNNENLSNNLVQLNSREPLFTTARAKLCVTLKQSPPPPKKKKGINQCNFASKLVLP